MESVRVKTYLSSKLTSLSLKLMSKHSLCALVPNRILETGFGWGRKFCSVAQSYPTLCNPMDFSAPVLPVHHQLPESTETQSVMPSNHLILYRPLLLLPSIFPSIRVFSSETALHIRWLKYWSFRFGISPSSEYSGLISFRINWFDLLAVQGPIESSPTAQFKNIPSLPLSLLYDPTLTSIHDCWKN